LSPPGGTGKIAAMDQQWLDEVDSEFADLTQEERTYVGGLEIRLRAKDAKTIAFVRRLCARC